jgi:3-dehydroquinate dehydratase-2
MEILILNGPNLNLLGIRQPDIYGKKTMDEVVGEIRGSFPTHTIKYFQSNHEGLLLDKLHEVGFSYDGIVMNAGAFAHTSIAIADAIRSINTPVVEMHISNIYEREDFRKHSYMKDACVHHIIGEGIGGYEKGVAYFIKS